MKKLLFSLLLLLTWQAYAQNGQTAKTSGDQVKLTCKIINAPPNAEFIFLFEQVGLGYREVARGQRQPDDSYVLTVPVSEPKVYSLGFNDVQNGRIILGREKEITYWANAEFMEKGRTIGSATNKAYESMREQLAALREESNRLRADLRIARASRNADNLKAAIDQLTAHGQAKTKFLADLKKENPMLWRSATLQLSPDFVSDKPGDSELDHYSKEYFGYADLNDPAYADVPEVYDAYREYILTISQMGATAVSSRKMITDQLAKLTPGTSVHRRALGGVIAGLQAANHPDYPSYAQQYVQAYRGQDLGEVSKIEYELKRNSTFTPGMEAPDLVGATPEGGSYALSKLRGKYVLVDFWASWCGPCRRENPNVKAMYEKYKEKGFDILGVSLDRTEDAWKKAIEQDGLMWHHISDLQGWKSEHAALYSVTSIPQTVLVDPEGKIIQRNLRGEQLGLKLQEIFGE